MNDALAGARLRDTGGFARETDLGRDGAGRERGVSVRRGGASVLPGGAGMLDLQRARVLSAMVRVVCERGVASVSVADIVACSGVSRRTFYEVFVDREDCLLAGLDDALRLAGERVVPAFEQQGRWRERVRDGLASLLGFFDERPQLARLLLLECLGMGAAALERREQAIAALVDVVDQGREEGKEARGLSPLTAEGVVGGAWSILQASVTGRERNSFLSLLNPLMGMIVMPYLGHAASASELTRPVGQPTTAVPHSLSASSSVDPFKDAGLRLTYRTVRVLLAVAENEGGSNRVLGDVAGIRDQGQISKLLGRLGRLGLIENRGEGQSAGAANEWCLTDVGRSMTSNIRTHTEIASMEVEQER